MKMQSKERYKPETTETTAINFLQTFEYHWETEDGHHFTLVTRETSTMTKEEWKLMGKRNKDKEGWGLVMDTLDKKEKEYWEIRDMGDLHNLYKEKKND